MKGSGLIMEDNLGEDVIAMVNEHSAAQDGSTDGIPDVIMREAADLYLRMHKCGQNVKSGIPEIRER